MNRPNVDSVELRLLERAAGKSPDAKDARRELFERHRDAAYRAAYRITGRSEDAMDAVQDGFIKAFAGLSGFQREAGFKTWLLRIVSNRALDLLRARKVRIAVPLDAGEDESAPQPAAREPGGGPLKRMEQRELAQRLQDAIDTLPPQQRAAFALYAGGEMTYGQIAEALGIPIGTVMSRIYHARRRLHEVLRDLAPQAKESPA